MTIKEFKIHTRLTHQQNFYVNDRKICFVWMSDPGRCFITPSLTETPEIPKEFVDWADSQLGNTNTFDEICSLTLNKLIEYYNNAQTKEPNAEG